MNIIILHNNLDKTSRDFIDDLSLNFPGEWENFELTMIDWYADDHGSYTGPSPSAFPSIIFELPERDVSVETDVDGVLETRITKKPAIDEIHRMPPREIVAVRALQVAEIHRTGQSLLKLGEAVERPMDTVRFPIIDGIRT